MASGILKVPAKHVPEVVRVIRVGLLHLVIEGELSPTDEVHVNLVKWCKNMDDYIAMLHGGPNDRAH